MIDILHQKPLLGRPINWAHPLATGLVGAWVFNEGSGNKVNDYSGNGSIGTLINGPLWVPGDKGHAVFFDGGNDQIVCDGSIRATDITDDITVVVKIKRNTTNDIVSGIVAKYGAIANTQSYLFRWPSSAGKIQFLYRGLTVSNVLSINSVVDLNWHQLVGKYDGSKLYVYIDAIEDNTAASTGSANSNTTDILFGLYDGNSLSTNIEYVYLYNIALLADVIAWLYREPYAMFQQNRARLFSVTGGTAVFASISDGLGISDTIITKTGYIRSAIDSVGVTDVLTRIATYIRSLAVNLATTDTINTASNLKRSMSENVGITDNITTKKFVLIAIADNLGITDTITRIITFIRSIPDTLAISDSLITIRTLARSIDDALGITDVLTSEKFILIAIADNVGITDTLTTIGTFIRGIADGVGITDVISRIGTFIRSESDNVGVADTMTPTKGVSRSIADSVGITDVLAAVVGKVISIADSLGIIDVLTFIKTTVVGGRIFIAGIAKSLRISGNKKSLTISGKDK